MNCEDFREIVHNLARPGTLDKPAAVMAQFHAQACEQCAAALAQAQVLALALAAAAQDASRFGAPTHLESSLVSAFREHHCGIERARYRDRRARLRWLEWLAVGATALALFAIGAWNLSRPKTKGAKTATVVALVPPVVPAASTIGRGNNGAKPSVTQGGTLESAVAQPDSTSDFVPVPYGEGFAPGDSGVIIRVEMPRGALADLGYSVDATHSADLVEADLLVGEDGWPRAVRLVH